VFSGGFRGAISGSLRQMFRGKMRYDFPFPCNGFGGPGDHIDRLETYDAVILVVLKAGVSAVPLCERARRLARELGVRRFSRANLQTLRR